MLELRSLSTYLNLTISVSLKKCQMPHSYCCLISNTGIEISQKIMQYSHVLVT